MHVSLSFPRFSRKRPFLLAVIPVALLVLVVVPTIGPILGLLNQISVLKAHAKPLKDALLLYDLNRLEAAVSDLKIDLTKFQSQAQRLGIYRAVPFVGSYASDLSHLANFSLQVTDSLTQVIEAIRPQAPSLGFKSSPATGSLASGPERLVGLAKVGPELAQKLTDLDSKMRQMQKELSQVSPQRYPDEFRGLKIKRELQLVKTAVENLPASIGDLSQFLNILPRSLGMERRQNYLILFQNDKELRPTGGFLTAYAVLTLEKGKIISSQASDSYFIDIDNKLSVYDPAPAIIQKYLKLSENKLFFRDANLSPDYKESVQTLLRIWNRSRLVPKVDGVVALDTHFVESLVAVLGEVAVPGYPKFNQENIVEQLELISNVLGSRLEKRQGRKDILGVLMNSLLQKAFSAGGKQYLNLLTTVWQEAEQKHFLAYFEEASLQSLAEKYNFAGRIKDFEGDYLHINDANFAGRKANWFIKEEVTKETKIEADGVATTLKIDYENTGKYHPDYNTGYRDYVRIYVPQGSKLVSSEGSLEPVTAGEDLGKTFFGAYLAVEPRQKVRLTLKYQSPPAIIKGNTYRLLVQKQPGTDRFGYEVKVGRRVEKFDLLKDREVEIKL